MILYEYPLHERIRTYLRLEHLFSRLHQLIERVDALDHHFALATLFEIMDVAARADLKSDLLKDLDKHKQTFESYRGNPAIAEDVLNQVIAQIDHCFADLNDQSSKASQPLAENDWLMGIRNRIVIPGGTCEFDLPLYYAWQHQHGTSRQADLTQWSSSFNPLSHAIALLLKLLRDSGSPQKVMASAGQFQQNLPQNRNFLLMRLAIDESLNLAPEISGNRMMVSVRMIRQGEDKRAQGVSEDVAFEMALCA